jgi:tRNA threonylcarbamoyladenosine biosynthesis protein TsaB
MPIILNLESSSEVCSIALSNGNEILSIVESSEPFSHTRKMTLFIQECLEETGLSMEDINAVAISHGPGSYTGLRVSASTAKGLCFGLKIPLIAVDTLEAIAINAKKQSSADIFIPMIDARRMEVYTTIYSNELEIISDTHNLIIEEDCFEAYDTQKIVLCGTGVEKTKEVFKTKDYDFMHFQLSSSFLVAPAYAKYTEGKFEDLVSYSPNYFKAPRITKSKKPLF